MICELYQSEGHWVVSLVCHHPTPSSAQQMCRVDLQAFPSLCREWQAPNPGLLHYIVIIRLYHII